MSRSRFACATIGVVMVCAVAAGQTTLVSINSTGVPGNDNSETLAISSAGRFVAFTSLATNLVAGDTNGFQDIFVRDRQSATTVRVSVDSAGVQGNAASWKPSISSDGVFVAFESQATNLIAADANGSVQDIYVRDRTSATTALVSKSTTGVQGNGLSFYCSISADGRSVAFNSVSTNLVANDTNGWTDVFVRDRTSGTTERVSVATSGTQGDLSSGNPSISADGRFVAFESQATTLVTGDTNALIDIFVRDRAAGTTVRASVHTSGAQSNADCAYDSISADGRFVAYQSLATNLINGDTNGVLDIFVRDLVSATTERVSLDSAGAEGNANSYAPSVSSGGRCVAFYSLASNLVAGDTNGFHDTFVHDRVSGLTDRVSIGAAGLQGNYHSYTASISSDARYVAFMSQASNFPGDTNNFRDIFMRDRGPQTPTSYCTAGTTSHACTAQISGNALPSLSLANACDIAVSGVEGLKSGILFYGVDNTGYTPGVWAPGSTSLLCVKHPTQRTPIQNSGGTFGACDGAFVLDWNAYQTANPLALGNPWSVGARVYAQAWFRDPLAVKSTNLSNAVVLTYVP